MLRVRGHPHVPRARRRISPRCRPSVAVDLHSPRHPLLVARQLPRRQRALPTSIDRIADIPAALIHGRSSQGPLDTAWMLHRRGPRAASSWSRTPGTAGPAWVLRWTPPSIVWPASCRAAIPDSPYVANSSTPEVPICVPAAGSRGVDLPRRSGGAFCARSRRSPQRGNRRSALGRTTSGLATGQRR